MSGTPVIGLGRVPAAVALLLEEAADNAAEAAARLVQLMNSDPQRLADELERREQDGDRITHDLARALRNRRVAARERGSLRQLGEALDDVVDAVQSAGMEAGRCDCGPRASQVAQVLRDMSRGNARAVRLLQGRAEERQAELERVRELGREGERLLRAAAAEAVLGQTDPLCAIARRGCVEQLRRATGAARQVAMAAERSATVYG